MLKKRIEFTLFCHVLNDPEHCVARGYAPFVRSTFHTSQVQRNSEGGGEGTSAGEDIHVVPEDPTTLHEVQGRDEG